MNFFVYLFLFRVSDTKHTEVFVEASIVCNL